MEIGIGIIGMGAMGQRHADIVRQRAGARLVAVADVNEQAAAQAGPGVAFESDYRALLSRPDVDAVSICSPDQMHLDMCLDAIAAGKHILVEKPLADRLDQAQRIAAAADASNVVFLVGHVLRFETHYAVCQQIVASGDLGDIVSIHAQRQNKLGDRRYQARTRVTMFLGVHDYDVLRWYTGSDPTRVYAESRSGLLESEGYDSEDSVWALMHFDGGTVCSVESSWILPDTQPGSNQRLEIVGTRGTLTLEAGYQGILMSGSQGVSYVGANLWPEVRGQIVGALTAEWDHFLGCIRDGTEPAVTAHDGLAAVKIATAVERSARLHQPVDFVGQE